MTTCSTSPRDIPEHCPTATEDGKVHSPARKKTRAAWKLTETWTETVPSHIQQSDFTIENMTIETLSSTQSMQDAIKIRRGATATITNALVKGSGAIENLVDLTDSKSNANSATSIQVTKEATNVEADQNSSNTGNGTVTIEAGHTGCPTDIFGWTGYTL